MSAHRFESGQMFVFKCGSEVDSKWASMIVTNVARNVAFGWFYGPFDSKVDAITEAPLVSPDSFVHRSVFGVTGIDSGEWTSIGVTDVDDSMFPLPPMTTGHIPKKGPHAGLLEIDVYGPDNLVGPADVRWVDPNMAGVDRLPTSGVEGAVYIEKVLARKFAELS